ncbi:MULTISPECIES: RNA polymerase sigma factor [unclassified Saccharothrix]|uniref:RNA polymerase sigma factor n=1 Tax=unclassified Saccharothrix TaxID=2593673 RepID=UPI00307F029D
MGEWNRGPEAAPDAVVAEVFRAERTRIVATLIRVTGDFELAEECVQDAFAQALERWPREGVPHRPGAWLTTAARNRAVDRVRRAAVEAAKLPLTLADPAEDDGFGDDVLRLVFTCCHPALSLEARVALTLHTVAGLAVGDIARAFLVAESTMAKRLVRARAKIRAARIPYRVPPAHLLPERTGGVLAVLYLLFNQGYSAVERWELCAEAIRLARTLVALMPDEPEAVGLLALMLLHDSRRTARVSGDDLVPFAEQDRSTWDASRIAEGTALLDRALRRGRPGPYQVQAAIAACHVADDGPDWPQIALLYGRLQALVPSPVVALNRAVAVSEADGPEAGLALVEALADQLSDHHLWHATRADLLRRLGRAGAAEAYRTAAALAPGEAERRFLARRADRCTG